MYTHNTLVQLAVQRAAQPARAMPLAAAATNPLSSSSGWVAGALHCNKAARLDMDMIWNLNKGGLNVKQYVPSGGWCWIAIQAAPPGTRRCKRYSRSLSTRPVVRQNSQAHAPAAHSSVWLEPHIMSCYIALYYTKKNNNY